MTIDIFEINHRLADTWIATDSAAKVDYSYGGTRMMAPESTESEVRDVLTRLMMSESTLKNHLINIALRRNALHKHADATPRGFMQSVVGGARCIIRARDNEIAAILKNPKHPLFQSTITPIFAQIGAFLNERDGTIKLTPDFGRFAGLADILAEFTPHVLGIRRESGGCGGKSSFSATGVIGALEAISTHERKNKPVTLIGAAGAMGSDVLAYLLKEGYQDLAVSDLVYEGGEQNALPHQATRLPASDGIFTDACLRRGSVIIATTVGHELEHSNWRLLPAGTLLLLAHNLAIPDGDEGIQLMQQIADQDVLAIPGQVLTLGGALTSRLEWFSRQAAPGQLFNKPQAHLIVKDVVRFLVSEIRQVAATSGMTPYAAMLEYAA